LTEILSRFTKIPIAEVLDGMQIERDHIYVIPLNQTMGIAGVKFVLLERATRKSPHLPIDYFSTFASDSGDLAIGIILSGTASDGTQVCMALNVDGFEVRHKFQHLGPRHMILNARRIEPQGGSQMILLSIEDITKKG
jgi:chemotaxis response regulator CheB